MEKNLEIKTEINFKKDFLVTCKMNCREYYDFRLLALQHKVVFLVKWETEYCLVTTEAPFLIKTGYQKGIDF